MTQRTLLSIATATVCVALAAAPAYARARYPYTLIDPGTFGGPSSYLDLPGVPITNNGTVLGQADTATPDSDWPNCFGCADPFIQHAFAGTDGRLTDLGALPGNNSSAIWELNDRGTGGGTSENGLIDPYMGTPAEVAVMFHDGQVTNLGTLPGGNESAAQDINDQGQVAGNSSNGTPDPFPDPNVFFPFGTETRGFVWRDGVMHDLGTLGGADTLEYAQNEPGQIIGASYTNRTPNPANGGFPTIDPYRWQDGRLTDLGTLGGTFGFANWLNDAGEVVGQSDLSGDKTFHPFLWNGRRMIDLGTLGGDFASANYVNDRGGVAGWALTAGDQRLDGFLWHHGTMTDLPPVGGAAFATAESVNDQDAVVGVLYDSNGNEISAFLWTGGRGYDLNTLVAPSSFQIISADYINNQGEIFGHGVYTSGPNAGDARVFVLIHNPLVPLPATSTAPRQLPHTHLPNPSALNPIALHGPDQDGYTSARIRQILIDRRR